MGCERTQASSRRRRASTHRSANSAATHGTIKPARPAPFLVDAGVVLSGTPAGAPNTGHIPATTAGTVQRATPMHRVEETQAEANNELLAIEGEGDRPLHAAVPETAAHPETAGHRLQLASDSGLVLLREVGRHALALLASRAGTRHRVNLAFATHAVEIHLPGASPRRACVRCLCPPNFAGLPQFSPLSLPRQNNPA